MKVPFKMVTFLRDMLLIFGGYGFQKECSDVPFQKGFMDFFREPVSMFFLGGSSLFLTLIVEKKTSHNQKSKSYPGSSKDNISQQRFRSCRNYFDQRLLSTNNVRDSSGASGWQCSGGTNLEVAPFWRNKTLISSTENHNMSIHKL